MVVHDVILSGDDRVDVTTRTELGWLIAARLLLAGLSLGLAVTLDQIEAFEAGSGIWGVYWTVAGAFLATVVSGLLVTRTANPTRFATVQVAIDLAIVTSLVHFSGGGESVFTFLYALVILYGALFLDRNGVVLSSGLAAAGYGFVLFGAEIGLLPSMSAGQGLPLSVLGAYWGFYAGALLVLGMLANSLSSKLRRAGAALDRRTTDLRRLRDLHLRTVESIGSGLLTTDDRNRVTSFNPEAERITGVSAADAAGQQLEQIIPGSTEMMLQTAPSDADAVTSQRDRIPYRNRRDENLFLGLGASSLRDEVGNQVGHVVIFQDVTDVVAMEMGLRQSERLAAVGEMAARMAHEIRNPLASISGSVQVMKGTMAPESSKSDAEQVRLMDIVVREVDRLNQLIGDFLRYSRPAPIKPEQVVLAELVEEVAAISESEPDNGVAIELDLDHTLVVTADPSQMKAVIWNLWNNAREAMEGRGKLTVRVQRIPGDDPQDQGTFRRNERSAGPESDQSTDWTAMLEIEDTGPGIDSDQQTTIFEPFFTTKRDGTGLGLATVRRIVEQHGGVIEVLSGQSGGACFRISLGCSLGWAEGPS